MPSHAASPPAGSPRGPAGGQDVALSAEDEDTLASLFANWERFGEAGGILAPLSPLSLSLLNFDQDIPNPGRQLARIIESDPVLAARVLGLSNSVAYAGGSRPVFRLEEAITRLGTDVVLTAAFAQLTANWLHGACRRADRSVIRELWFEYLITACCAREIAEGLPGGEVDPSQAYAAGLLHDIGTIALLCAQPAEMTRFLHAGYGAHGPLHAPFLGAHARLGQALLRSWRVPGDIALVAGRHHSRTVLSEAAVSIVVVLADHLHAAVLDHDRAVFSDGLPPAGGCFGGATEFVSAALGALDLAGDLDTLVGRVAAESRSIEALGAAIRS
ncbi:MAG TPA: HDOD domain-containing protein [Burkholderiales bacterium]|nr:HDOD domain-containing protein [Burkholderiales bacterium]